MSNEVNKPEDIEKCHDGKGNYNCEGVIINCDLGSYFEACELGDLNFENAVFNNNITFKDSNIGGIANFKNTVFSEYVDFSQVTFFREVSFEDSTFKAVVDFSSAEFFGLAEFHRAEFLDNIYFREGRFVNGAKFIHANFQGAAAFNDIDPVKVVSFYRANFSYSLKLDVTDENKYAKINFSECVFDTDDVEISTDLWNKFLEDNDIAKSEIYERVKTGLLKLKPYKDYSKIEFEWYTNLNFKIREVIIDLSIQVLSFLILVVSLGSLTKYLGNFTNDAAFITTLIIFVGYLYFYHYILKKNPTYDSKEVFKFVTILLIISLAILIFFNIGDIWFRWFFFLFMSSIWFDRFRIHVIVPMLIRKLYIRKPMIIADFSNSQINAWKIKIIKLATKSNRY